MTVESYTRFRGDFYGTLAFRNAIIQNVRRLRRRYSMFSMITAHWSPFLVSKLKLFVQSSCGVMKCAHEARIFVEDRKCFSKFHHDVWNPVQSISDALGFHSGENCLLACLGDKINQGFRNLCTVDDNKFIEGIIIIQDSVTEKCADFVIQGRNLPIRSLCIYV